jgi:hypothetical protein
MAAVERSRAVGIAGIVGIVAGGVCSLAAGSKRSVGSGKSKLAKFEVVMTQRAEKHLLERDYRKKIHDKRKCYMGNKGSTER